MGWDQAFEVLPFEVPGTSWGGTFQSTDPAGVKPAYVVSRGAGAPLTKKATPQTGGYHNYLVAQVKGADVTVTVNKTP